MDWSDRIGRQLKLRDLHILMKVADTGSMAKAAARLRISHPAVSKAISEIEGTLGVGRNLGVVDVQPELVQRPKQPGLFLLAPHRASVQSLRTSLQSADSGSSPGGK